MSKQLDPCAILAHLNEMGYYNISTYQLKEFMIDLKKLIKYENRQIKEARKRAAEQKSAQLAATPTFSSKAKCTQIQINSQKNLNKEKHSLNQTKQPRSSRPRSSSRNKELPQNKSVINVCEKSKNRIVRQCQSMPQNIGKSVSNKNQDSSIKLEEPKIKIVRECQSMHQNLVPRSKKSVRPLSAGNNKLGMDPVSLYHRYKEEWDRHKIPGENDHSNLRWAIRQRMLTF